MNGQRLIGPQGSNDFGIPQESGGPVDEYFTALQIPRRFDYQPWDKTRKALRFGLDNYGPMFWTEEDLSVGYFFDDAATGDAPRWTVSPWARGLEGVPFPENVKKDLLTWRNTEARPYQGDDLPGYLDSMTYQHYIEEVLGLDPQVTEYAHPLLAGAIGLGCDALSAYSAYQIGLPGVRAYSSRSRLGSRTLHSFPGGNDGVARFFVKFLIPDAIHGAHNFPDILNRGVNFDAVDRAGNSVRIRASATVVRVEHDGPPHSSEHVLVTYVRDGKPYRLKARGVVMASGGWINRSIVRDLPGEHMEAYKQFHHSPILVVNVALTNWRFLYKLGITACRWFDGFGFSCNIRQPMIVGDHRPPLDPDEPIVMTFYVPFYYPGRAIEVQGRYGASRLLATSFHEYEQQIREQMVRLFGRAGFDPSRDIAGLILNRWGHAYVNPQPGFYFGQYGKPAPREIIRNRFGRMAFGHSELNGHQNWVVAVGEGRRAAGQVFVPDAK